VKPHYTYTVGADDLLRIEVWKEPDLNREVRIGPDGRLQFPLVGNLLVQDRTLKQVAELVYEKLRDVLTEPFVTVTLLQSSFARVHVLGEVADQGPQPFHDRMTLVEVLAVADIDWITAKTEVVGVVRGSLDDPILIEVNLEDVFVGVEKDVFLRPGDIVVVPPKYVTRFDRFVTQLLAPVRALSGAARDGAFVATGGVSP